MLEGIAHLQPLSLTLDVAARESYPLADPWTHRSHPTRKTPPPRSATCASFPLFLFPFSLPSPFSFLSFLFLPFFAGRWRGMDDVTGTYPDGMDSSSPLYPSFFQVKRAFWAGWMVALFLFFFFFPPAFLNEPMEASVERRLRFGLYRLILRCKLNFLEREREGGFLRDK